MGELKGLLATLEALYFFRGLQSAASGIKRKGRMYLNRLELMYWLVLGLVFCDFLV